MGAVPPGSVTEEVAPTVVLFMAFGRGAVAQERWFPFLTPKAPGRDVNTATRRPLLEMCCDIHVSYKDTSGEGLVLQWGLSLQVARLWAWGARLH